MSEAEQKVRFVITMFRLLGWPFAILLVPSAALVILAAIYKVFTDTELKFSPFMSLAVVLVVALMAFTPVYMLRVAKRMARRDLTAYGPAKAISVILLFIGFPLSTFVGLFFLLRIRNYYKAYCGERQSPVSELPPSSSV